MQSLWIGDTVGAEKNDKRSDSSWPSRENIRGRKRPFHIESYSSMQNGLFRWDAE